MDEQPASVQTPGSGQGLDRRAELSEFLRTRRARLKPEDVGLPVFGRHRRVQGLRREELAQLAGVSVAYYTRLEQGNGRNVSAEVLDSIARALRLTDAEHAHLTDLAKPRAHRKPKARTQQVRGALRQLLDSIDAIPAFIIGCRTDVLAWNRMAVAVFGDWSQLPATERNWARLVFLGPEYRELYVDWDQWASDMVAHCAWTAAATRTTPGCPLWWANSPSRARSSGGCGPRTTSGRRATVSSA
jgi:transcriptional regulator with XRE-family HTH domain